MFPFLVYFKPCDMITQTENYKYFCQNSDTQRHSNREKYLIKCIAYAAIHLID